MPVCPCRPSSLIRTALALLCLTMATPLVAQTGQGSDKPPASATIVSITDLPDNPIKRKKGVRRRTVRVHGRAFSRRNTLSKKFQTATQRRNALQLKQQQALAKANVARVALQNRAKQAEEKPKQIAQKVAEKQNAVKERTTPPQVTAQTTPNTKETTAPPKPAEQKPKQVAEANTPPPPPANTIKPTVTNPTAKPPAQSPVAGAIPKPAETKPAPVVGTQKPVDSNTTPTGINPNVLKDTKQDVGTTTSAQPKEGSALGTINPLQGLFALIATVGITVGGLALIRRRYMNPAMASASHVNNLTGKPAQGGLLGRLLGGTLSGKARDKSGSNIRLIETMPTGNNSFIHLVEVHGKQFVVGATPWQISMLTEVGDENLATQAEFRDILRSAAGSLMPEGNESTLAMNGIDGDLRETNNAVVQNIERIRSLRNSSRNND